MVYEDLRGWLADHDRATDVCVVGAGAAGLVLARRLAAQGIDVMVVESGGVRHGPRVSALNGGTAVGRRYHYLTDGRARGLGGSTRLWAGQCVELRAHDLQRRSWLAHSGWPVDHASLQPYQADAAAALGVGGRVPVRAVHAARGLAPPALGDVCEPFATVVAPHLDLGDRFRDEIARSTRITCVVNATVVGIHQDHDRHRIEQLTVSTLDGQRATISPSAVVLCAGGIENPRLLLAAADEGIAPGDRHGQVGRYLQEHPSAVTARLTTDDVGWLLAYFDLGSYNGLRYWPKLGTTPRVERDEAIAGASAALELAWGDPEAIGVARAVAGGLRRRAPSGRQIATAVRHLPRIASAAYRDIGARRRWPYARPTDIGLRVQIEQEPNAASRVVLDRDRDALGVARPRVDWRLSARDGRTFAVATGLFASAVRRAGLASASTDCHMTPERVLEGVDESYHPSGTTRMSVDERTGVVDADLRVHGTPNLYVCGSSVFPIAGYGNPTQTLCALALRLADHLGADAGRARRRISVGRTGS